MNNILGLMTTWEVLLEDGLGYLECTNFRGYLIKSRFEALLKTD